jgi:hypothetical protein
VLACSADGDVCDAHGRCGPGCFEGQVSRIRHLGVAGGFRMGRGRVRGAGATECGRYVSEGAIGEDVWGIVNPCRFVRMVYG